MDFFILNIIAIEELPRVSMHLGILQSVSLLCRWYDQFPWFVYVTTAMRVLRGYYFIEVSAAIA